MVEAVALAATVEDAAVGVLEGTEAAEEEVVALEEIEDVEVPLAGAAEADLGATVEAVAVDSLVVGAGPKEGKILSTFLITKLLTRLQRIPTRRCQY